MEDIAGPEEFEWDDANRVKLALKHGISHIECEEVFMNEPVYVGQDELHSRDEDRHIILGPTNQGRYLFIVYTMRRGKVRVVTARKMEPNERRHYIKICNSEL